MVASPSAAARHRGGITFRDGGVSGGISFRDGESSVREALQKAHDRIQEARETYGSSTSQDERTGVDATFYLDAARDLYNAARREAEAGRDERAAELARAAEALTLVPQHLPRIKSDRTQDDAEDRPESRSRGEGATPRLERRVFPGRGGEAATKEQGARPRAEVEAEQDVERRDAGVVGIGVALTFEEDRLRVSGVLPGGPAARDGRLKEGDVLVGVEGPDGERIEFEGKPPEAIVRLIRGKPGSKVRLIVDPKGPDEEKVIELTRERLQIEVDRPRPEGS